MLAFTALDSGGALTNASAAGLIPHIGAA